MYSRQIVFDNQDDDPSLSKSKVNGIKSFWLTEKGY